MNIQEMIYQENRIPPVRHGRWDAYTHSRYCGIDKYGEPIYRDGTYTTALTRNAGEKPW